MLSLLIIAIIIFALVQRHRCRQWTWDKGGRRVVGPNYDFDRWSRHFEHKAEKFERKLRRKMDRQTRKYGVDSADPHQDETHPTFKTEAERQAYRRARRRAAAEAGFYVHLMWYGLVIGLLFWINLLTSSSYLWFLWPASFWGFGVISHFTAVFGWRWIHQRVFVPAIEREVQREVQQEKEVLRTEKQASLDELTASFAHEIRNPIAAARSLVQQMGEDPTSTENVEYARVALDELARVERSVSHLLKFAKEEDYHFENVNLATVLDGALLQMRAKLESNAVGVSRSYLNGPVVRADADKLRQVFSNIVDNAIDAMAEVKSDRRIEVAIQNVADQNGRAGMGLVRLRDNGCGIPEDRISKIFNPFYTSKPSGTGLGLGIAKKVLDAHRGAIEVSSHAGEGTEFIISIPLADAAREFSLNGDESMNSSDSNGSNGPAVTPVSPMPGATNDSSVRP
jgi:signal transduction histidine kinase